MLKRHYSLPAAIILAISLLNGCASTPKSQMLDDARNAYTQADANPDVQKYAAVNLYDAKLALQKAESAEQKEEQVHLAYLAKRQVELTMAVAQRKRIEASLDSMAEQRDQVRIDLRDKATERAQGEAELARLAALEAEERALAARGRVKILEEELANAKKTDRGLVLTLGDVLFTTGKADLAAGAYRDIENLVTFLNAHPERKVAVEGHADSRGSEASNLDLSQRRAEAVVTAIVSRGISRSRITTRGFGESAPIASNETTIGQQLNRRVEIIVLNPNKS